MQRLWIIISILSTNSLCTADSLVADYKSGHFLTVYTSHNEQIVIRKCLAVSLSMKRPAYECAGTLVATVSKADFLISIVDALSLVSPLNSVAAPEDLSKSIEILQEAIDSDLVVELTLAEKELDALRSKLGRVILHSKLLKGATTASIQLISKTESEGVSFSPADWIEKLAKRDLYVLERSRIAEQIELERQKELRRQNKEAAAKQQTKLRDAVQNLQITHPSRWTVPQHIGSWNHITLYYDTTGGKGWISPVPNCRNIEEFNLLKHSLKEFYLDKLGYDLDLAIFNRNGWQ